MTKFKVLWKELTLLPMPLWGLSLAILIGLGLLFQSRPAPQAEPTPLPRVVLPPRRTVLPLTTPVAYTPLAHSEAPAIFSMTPIPSATATPTPRPPLFTFHRIKRGETLISIASVYGVTSEAVLAANQIRDPTNLEIGQTLLIPPQEGLRVPIVLHEIETGDTLLDIAMQYSSSVKDIVEANPNLNPASLPAGQTVAVPIVFNEARPAPRPADSADPVYYTVQEGDMPLLIAAEYDIPVELLLAANDITDPTTLQIGRQLLIPPNEGVSQGVPIILYELEANDTLLGIAARFGSSVKDILAVNPDLIPSALQAGQTVAIPVIFPLPRPTPPPAPAATRAPIPPPVSRVELEQQMVAGVNAQREEAGLPAYSVDQELTQLALDHAQDMVVRGYFSHVTLEGLALQDRFEEAGIGAYNVGEDIQRNTRPASETVQFALNWFMGSRPHRHNILHPNHNRIGVGIVEGPPGWYTYVLVFAER